MFSPIDISGDKFPEIDHSLQYNSKGIKNDIGFGKGIYRGQVDQEGKAKGFGRFTYSVRVYDGCWFYFGQWKDNK